MHVLTQGSSYVFAGAGCCWSLAGCLSTSIGCRPAASPILKVIYPLTGYRSGTRTRFPGDAAAQGGIGDLTQYTPQRAVSASACKEEQFSRRVFRSKANNMHFGDLKFVARATDQMPLLDYTDMLKQNTRCLC